MIGVSDISAVLKTKYIKGNRLGKVVHGSSSRFALNNLMKDPKVPRDYKVPVLSDYGGSATANYTDAAGQSTAPTLSEFVLPPDPELKKLTRSTKLKAATILAADGDPKGFLTNLQLQTDQTLEVMADVAEFHCWDDGYATIGRVQNTSFATAVLQLGNGTAAEKRYAKYYRKGMKVQVIPNTAKSAAPRASGATLTVSAVNAATGAITMTANLSTITSIAQHDYIVPLGLAYGAASGDYLINTFKAPIGFRGWYSVAGAASSLFGVDTAAQAGKLSMLTHAGSASNLKKTFQDANALARVMNGGKRNMVAVGPEDFVALEDQLKAQVQFQPGKGVVAGYSFISINTADEQLRVISTDHLFPGEGFVLDWGSWVMPHLGPKVIDFDRSGGTIARHLSDDNGAEIRGLSHRNQVSNAPGRNVYVTYS